MAVVASEGARVLADLLNARFGASYGKFEIRPGRRYDKIVCTPNRTTQTHVHAFVECETGYVYKPNGTTSPAKGVRYTSAEQAGMAADPYGRYLYVR